MYALRSSEGIACYVLSRNGEISWQVIDGNGVLLDKRIPFKTKGLNSRELFFGATALSDDGKILAMGMCSFPRLYLFNRKTGKSLSIAPDLYADSAVKALLRSPEARQKMFYCGAHIAGDRIYAMYLDPSPTIQVFDFEGNLYDVISIPDMLVNFIVEDGTITGITPDGEVVRYRKES